MKLLHETLPQRIRRVCGKTLYQRQVLTSFSPTLLGVSLLVLGIAALGIYLGLAMATFMDVYSSARTNIF